MDRALHHPGRFRIGGRSCEAVGTKYLVPQEKLNQVYMALFRGGEQIYSEDYSKHLVVNPILRGTFSSRLVEKLRHDGYDIYSANLVQILTQRIPGMVAFVTSMRADNPIPVCLQQSGDLWFGSRGHGGWMM